jgi:hypothetical protein
MGIKRLFPGLRKRWLVWRIRRAEISLERFCERHEVGTDYVQTLTTLSKADFREYQELNFELRRLKRRVPWGGKSYSFLP